MLRFASLTALALTLFATTLARADPAPPPPWMPPQQQSADWLRHRGHRNKIAGGVMMGVGSLLLATSITLNVIEVIGPVDHGCTYFSNVCADGAHRRPYWVGSMAAFATGLPILGGGIAAYAVGGYQMRKAKRLELTGVAAAPLPSGGAVASASFAF